MYIGGDSGPLHLAATTRVPIVAIFGPTPSERSAPWRDPALPTAVDRSGRAALPSVRSARLRTRRLPLPDAHRRRTRHRRGRTPARSPRGRAIPRPLERVVSGASATRFGVLAYGSRAALHREAAVALLTIKAHAPAASEVVLLTDRPGHYRWFGNSITIDRLTPAIVREWRGRYDDPVSTQPGGAAPARG